MLVITPAIPQSIRALDGTILKCDVYEIGGWDMDTVFTKNINHNIADRSKVTSIVVSITDDAQDWVWSSIAPAKNVNTQMKIEINATQIVLGSINGGEFDNPAFNNALVNRGYVTIWYVS